MMILKKVAVFLTTSCNETNVWHIGQTPRTGPHESFRAIVEPAWHLRGDMHQMKAVNPLKPSHVYSGRKFRAALSSATRRLSSANFLRSSSSSAQTHTTSKTMHTWPDTCLHVQGQKQRTHDRTRGRMAVNLEMLSTVPGSAS